MLTDHELLLYVFLGMFCTWFVQVNSLKYKKAKRIEKVRNSFVCSLFTASVSIPLLEYFDSLPHSVTLIIGAVVGTLGQDGWDRLIHLIIDVVQSRLGTNRYGPYGGGGYISTHRSDAHTTKQYGVDDDDDEPPLPEKRTK